MKNIILDPENGHIPGAENKHAVERLTEIVMSYDFYDVANTVPDVRYVVEELNEYHYNALQSEQEYGKLHRYFEEMQKAAPEGTEEYDDYKDALDILEKHKVKIASTDKSPRTND